MVIERAHFHTLRKLGPSVEVTFKVESGPQAGNLALGQFPTAGKGLPILLAAALGESITAWDDSLAARLVGARVLADVIRSGAAEKPQAIVRNLRAPGPASASWLDAPVAWALPREARAFTGR